ncbi:MAG: hypothetical protein IKJ74_07435 [Clostridia bacterium]|nr:hypothetical protein [Clostridia bacterium]
MIFRISVSAPPICEGEILRYAGSFQNDPQTVALLRECLEEAEGKFTYRVCYRLLEEDNALLASEPLKAYFSPCKKRVVFAATVGVEIDRLITKYGRISPARALMLQAIGTERVEALCDAFCQSLEREYQMKAVRRISPGYGKLPLSLQKEIFDLLDCQRQIGLTLGSSLLMCPTKSVTAFVGLKERT